MTTAKHTPKKLRAKRRSRAEVCISACQGIEDPEAVLQEVRETLSKIILNAFQAPDPRMDGATDCFLLPTEDIHAAEDALEKLGGGA